MARHLYFVRHGESNSNEDGIFRGESAALTEKGQKEARLVAQRLERIGVEALLSSTYDRTLQTAEPAHALLGIPIEQNELFIEWRRPSSHIGARRTDPTIEKESATILEQFGITDYHHSDEETFEEMRARAVSALAFLAQHPKERVAIVTHGIFLRMLLCVIAMGEECSGAEFRRMWRFVMDNTGITYARACKEGGWQKGWEIVSWNDSAHLG
jgi:broad specificity phosphatase PhoE